MGWLFPILFASLTFAGLWRSGRCPRMALEIAGAALLLGICGYSWQGSPDMAGQPTGGLGAVKLPATPP